MKAFRLLGVAFISALMCIGFAACSGDDDDSSGIVGKWICTNKYNDAPYWVFNSDGTGYAYSGSKESFSYKLSGTTLTVAWDDDWEYPDVWTAIISDNTLTLYYDNGEVDWAFQKDGTSEDDADEDDSSSGAKAVDLGLPSGTKWADRNVGASSPEDYGDYFAWGETKPKDKYTTQNCSTYDTHNPSFSDAAKANWGDNWKTPNTTQIKELIDKCKWVQTSQNGVNGYLVTGTNGNSIFLPAGGFKHESKLTLLGKRGDYWSCEEQEPSGLLAYTLFFSTENGTIKWACMGRYRGNSVRPVSK